MGADRVRVATSSDRLRADPPILLARSLKWPQVCSTACRSCLQVCNKARCCWLSVYESTFSTNGWGKSSSGNGGGPGGVVQSPVGGFRWALHDIQKLQVFSHNLSSPACSLNREQVTQRLVLL